ncbi:DNA topoisomerase 2-associated protein pat1 [Marasmius crinis-equi]|uniref:DNA topoisomerase 2-associated protein pat1 n=1 Tax=Marasmius crinis-equi TaxID=585013 RepID=A0ABR3FUU9_9AGAR
MSFFGFEQTDLEKEKQQFLHGKLNASDINDLSVHVWGEESYDGLGDALEEGGDDLNDQTFGGGGGAVGTDFDFTSATAVPGAEELKPKSKAFQAPKDELSGLYASRSSPSQAARPPISSQISLESIWDDKSPFSMRLNGAGRSSASYGRTQSPSTLQQPIGHGLKQSGARTLQEIEAEMRAAAEQSREQTLQRQLFGRQQEQRQQEEEYRRLQLEQQEQQQQQQQAQQMRQEMERELLQRQRFIQQQQEQQLHLQRLQQQQILHQREQQHHRTPPPRMLPVSQSPRFLEHQRLLLLQQQQQEQQQQLLRLQQVEEQLRMEELERQMRLQQISHHGNNFPDHDRHPSGPTLADMETLLLLQQQQQREVPTVRRAHSPLNASVQENALYAQQPNVQLQQRLLAEMANAEFLRDMQGLSQADQEILRAEAMRKIVEAEKMEEKRRRKAAKIAHMSRYNDLMTQSDKDFITRIQVSQLVTQDPYADDFYAQVYGAIMRSRMGLGSDDERVLKFGTSGGVGLGVSQRGANRRPNAMQRMQQQVERIVSNARRREEEKGIHCMLFGVIARRQPTDIITAIHSLQGALGKTSGRSYKAAPRQLLQVDSNSSPTLSHAQAHGHISKHEEDSDHVDDAAAKAAKLGREALGEHTAEASFLIGGELVREDPLTRREVLVTLETLYDLVLQLEQLKRNPAPPEDEQANAEWEYDFKTVLDKTWVLLKVMVPLATSDPHPFISILSVAKGKKLLPRLTRHLDSQRMLTLLTLLIACFSQLDVIVKAPLLDTTAEETPEHAEVERQTQAFLSGVIQSILPIIAKGSLRLVSGLLGLLLDRNDVAAIAKTRPGLALLTLLLTRVEVIKESLHNATNIDELPSPEDADQWQLMFDHLFQLLTPHFPYLFPSSRMPQAEPGQVRPGVDSLDQPVWQFLAALALHAVTEQHQILVTLLREKVLDNVMAVKKGWVMDEEERQTKLANVDLFLHALGLDSSQIAM